MMCGAMIASAKLKRLLIIDGFIASSAFLVARDIFPQISEFSIFSHLSKEKGHKKLLKYLKVKALLDLNLRLGEGTGAVLAFPLIMSSVLFLKNMSSFKTAGLSKTKKNV